MSQLEEIVVRQAISSDVPGLIALDHGYSTDHVWQMAFQEERRQKAVTFREVRLPRPMRVAYPRDPERLADEWTQAQALLIAERGEDPLGYLRLSAGLAPGSAWVTDVVVALRFRRQGIASRLIHAACGWASERGYGRVFMEMQHKNYPAIALARKLGFRFVGFSDEYYLDQDIALFFALSLT